MDENVCPEKSRCWGTELVCVGMCALEGFVFEVKRGNVWRCRKTNQGQRPIEGAV